LDLFYNYSAQLKVLTPLALAVPSGPSRTPSQLVAKSKIWPVLHSPSPAKPTDGRTWSPARRAWVRAGIDRVIADALAADAKGDLPVAVYCTSAPESLWPREEHFIHPTPGMRASSHDTRTTESHPLRHATLNCIASIARLRTVPPFSEINPTRNGADYLLTSLSLFVSHEPCVMCVMALLHSRVREVFYVVPRKRGGGFGAGGEGFAIHGHKGLNHRFEVWRWDGELGEGVREGLQVDEGIAL
jgi:tRNA-specific adenosine deaminase 3